MKKLVFFSLFLLVSASRVCAQEHRLSGPSAYLGQKPPGDQPEIFAPKMLLPDSGIALDRSAWSADQRAYYYCTAQHFFDARGAKVRYFKYDGKKWQGPFILNQGYYAPTFSIDGKTLYFLGGKPDSLHGQVWQAHLSGGKWTEPEIYLSKPYGLYDFMPTRSGTCYIGSNAHQGNRKDYTTYDFCTLTFNKGDTVVQNIGAPVSTPGFDGDFYVAPDESFMIVSNKETKEYNSELAITFRRPDHSWTEPQSLGPLINDGKANRWGEYVTPDGKYLFYTKATSERDCHIYWVRFDLLKDRLKKQAGIM